MSAGCAKSRIQMSLNLLRLKETNIVFSLFSLAYVNEIQNVQIVSCNFNMFLFVLDILFALFWKTGCHLLSRAVNLAIRFLCYTVQLDLSKQLKDNQKCLLKTGAGLIQVNLFLFVIIGNRNTGFLIQVTCLI